MAFEEYTPSLTLEPELETTAELVVQEPAPQEPSIAEPVLSAQEQQIVADFAAKIDVENTAQILQYGTGQGPLRTQGEPHPRGYSLENPKLEQSGRQTLAIRRLK